LYRVGILVIEPHVGPGRRLERCIRPLGVAQACKQKDEGQGWKRTPI
jgi:hypothetical protein